MITHPELADKILQQTLGTIDTISLLELSAKLDEDYELLHAIIMEIGHYNDTWLQTNFHPYKGGIAGNLRANPAYRSSIKLFLNNGGFLAINQSENEQAEQTEMVSKLQFEILKGQVDELKEKKSKDTEARRLAWAAILAAVIVPIVLEIIKTLWGK